MAAVRTKRDGRRYLEWTLQPEPSEITYISALRFHVARAQRERTRRPRRSPRGSVSTRDMVEVLPAGRARCPARVADHRRQRVRLVRGGAYRDVATAE